MHNLFSVRHRFLAIVATLVLTACGMESADTPKMWTWISGSTTGNQTGVYGVQGNADANNAPGGREYPGSWTDSKYTLWIFGGFGYGTAGLGSLNDLWKYEKNSWTWVAGNNTLNQPGIYTDVDPANNLPGARSQFITWTDSHDVLWLFGGSGRDSVNANGRLNDLWKFDGTAWSWVSGSNLVNQPGVYNDAVAVNNVPGARYGAVSWTDSSDNLWLFGGYGYDSGGIYGVLNDLWKFDGTNWTWVAGSNTVNQLGIYSDPTPSNNTPGARYGAVSWIDSSDNLWLFGGIPYSTAIPSPRLNDLWKFDGTNWTWVSGSNTVNQLGIYSDADPANNVPGARNGAVSWIDSNNNLWLFGGVYQLSISSEISRLNDLWKFDGTNWVWVSGSDTVNQAGNYGILNLGATSNVPGARLYAASAISSTGTLRLFGGQGMDSSGTVVLLNDLWSYRPE